MIKISRETGQRKRGCELGRGTGNIRGGCLIRFVAATCQVIMGTSEMAHCGEKEREAKENLYCLCKGKFTISFQ